jgi:uncharacterized protein (DUF362 family)
MARFVGKGQRVLVKPNLLASRAPEAAVTTHPAVVQAVVEEVQRAGGWRVKGGIFKILKSSPLSHVRIMPLLWRGTRLHLIIYSK